MMGLTPGSYEAWCFDEAVWYFGSVITSELEKVGRPKGKGAKGQASAEAQRTRVLNKYLGNAAPVKFADPAALFPQE